MLDTGFLSGLTGEIITPFDKNYDEARQVYNRSIQRFPLVIVYCEHKSDIVNAVLWSRQHSVSIRVRNGGHHYEGYSVGDCVLVIDLSRMHKLQLNEAQRQLTIERGVTNRQLYGFVSSMGYPFAGGSCPTVGVAGYTMGGGFGYSARLLGLGCDSLVEVSMVNADGEVITANSTCNPDLFWACRGGGGGNFGVVFSMTYALTPKVDKVTFLELYYPDMDSEKQARFVCAWQDWLTHVDKRITLTAAIYHSAQEGMAVYCRGIFYGVPEQAEAILQPLLQIDGAQLGMRYVTFLEAMTIIQSLYPPSEMFKQVGRFEYNRFSYEGALGLVNLIKERPEGSVYAGVTLYALGGKVAEVAPCDTAFPYRHAHYIMALQTIWENAAAKKVNVKWLNAQSDCFERLTQGAYVNFPYSNYSDYMKEYYSCNACRLSDVKTRYDPDNVFHFPQSIPVLEA